MRKLGDRELSLLGNDVTEELLRIRLGEKRNTQILSELGLISGDGTLTQSGMKILSAYPYFGRGTGERRRYPRMLFSFLLSLSSSLPSPYFDSPFFRKESFVGLFPTLERKRISRMAYLIGKALKEINLFTPCGLVERKRASSFMALTLHERMSWVLGALTASSSGSASRALSLLEYINGLEKERLDEVLGSVERYSSLKIDLSLLYDIGLIYEDEDGLVYSCSLDEEDEEGLYSLSSDYTLTYSGGRDRDIYLIAEPLSQDHNTTQWMITRKSVKRALDSSFNADEIIQILSDYSSYGVSDVIKNQIREWEREYTQVRIIRGTVVITEERFSPLFTLPEVKKHILEKIGERAYLFNSETIGEWRSELESYGVSMLGTAKGPDFASTRSYGIYDTFTGLEKKLKLAEKREIAFDADSYNSLLETALNEWEKMLVTSHLVFSQEAMRAYPFVDGLEYSMKKELIRDAIKDEKAIVTKDTEGNYSFYIPLKSEGDSLTTDRGELAISKIWKVASAPKCILRKAEEP